MTQLSTLILIARASTHVQGASVEAQQERGAAWAKAHAVPVLIDPRFCALESGAKKHRVSVELALAEIKAGNAAGIIVTKLDRLGRSLEEILRIVRELNALNARLVVIDQQVDTGSAQGRLFLQLLGAFAEFEREMIRERTLESKARARVAGKYLGGGVPFGLQLVCKLHELTECASCTELGAQNELAANLLEQKVIAYAARCRAGGLSFQQVADALNSAGYDKRGKSFTRDDVCRILSQAAVVPGDTAQESGRKGGSATSLKKAAAARTNGAKGGRPRKHSQNVS